MEQTIKEFFDYACEQARKRAPSPEPFELKNLFSTKEWKQLPNDVRRKLGQEFSYAVGKGAIENLRYAGENTSHHNLYIKD